MPAIREESPRISLPRPGHILHLDLDRTNGPERRVTLSFSLCVMKQKVTSVSDMKNTY